LVTKEHEGAIFNYHIMRLRLAENVIDPDFFLAYVRGSSTVNHYVKEVNHGATRDGINTEQLLAMPVVLPPLAEQRRIVAEVERRLEGAQEVESVVAASVARAGRLRQSVLKSAFEGRLTP
jgi:type I restriction enzyme S subunit